MKPLAQRTRDPDFIVRKMKPEDREQIRHICCETGFLGDPIDPVFSDRDLFADFLTRYYTDVEPESCWVGIKNGRVIGYLLAARRWNLYRLWNLWNTIRLGVKAGWKWTTGKLDAHSRKFIYWSLTRGWRETPPAPRRSAHFHFNSLKEHRRMGVARDLLLLMLEDMRARGVKRIYGQMATYDHRRSDRLYEYLGWKVINKTPVTKYQHKIDKPVYMTTIVREFETW